MALVAKPGCLFLGMGRLSAISFQISAPDIRSQIFLRISDTRDQTSDRAVSGSSVFSFQFSVLRAEVLLIAWIKFLLQRFFSRDTVRPNPESWLRSVCLVPGGGPPVAMQPRWLRRWSRTARPHGLRVP